MSRIGVLVASTTQDVKAEVIAASVANRSDMRLMGSRVVRTSEVNGILASLPEKYCVALVLVGAPADVNQLSETFLSQRSELVVLQVDIVGSDVRITLTDPRLNPLLNSLRKLLEHSGSHGVRIAHIQLADDAIPTKDQAHQIPPLLAASIRWVHAVYCDAVSRVPDENGDANGFSLTRATLLEQLSNANGHPNDYGTAHEDLEQVLREASTSSEPLALTAHTFELQFLEFQFLVLALSPEIDIRYQRCIGFLLDDMSRRVGTLGLYCSLLGAAPEVRLQLGNMSSLEKWLVFDSQETFADDPLRLDPHLSRWLLCDSHGLASDARIKRITQSRSWRGVSLLTRPEDCSNAVKVINRLRHSCDTRWFLLGEEPENWRALLELGAQHQRLCLIRVATRSLSGLAPSDIEDCAKRVGRLARLTDDPLVIDTTGSDEGEPDNASVAQFFQALDDMGCYAAVICPDITRIVCQLGNAEFEVVSDKPLSDSTRVTAFLAAANSAGAYFSGKEAEQLSQLYPLTLDRLEHAASLAARSASNYDTTKTPSRRFTLACRDLAVEGISHIADRIEPVFRIEDVVLPEDRASQLAEIVDHIRLAPKVLDGWKFGDQLPYGRGVTALFSGPSGTGKTMAAMGIANNLGAQLLRVDLSRVVSKYIGDTEKNIDRVFSDAQRSGSTILIDEADALLGKRSEVKDAHDRYANIEVAYLLQRMEAYEGLAILTSNMRQNLDAAFLRRIRFIVDFPRPDVAAREQIWRFCLPEESHNLNDAAFRQLARKIELTGGHIRQISLRAAFIAAAEDTQIKLEHLATAARAEYAKLGMPPADIDLDAGRRAA